MNQRIVFALGAALSCAALGTLSSRRLSRRVDALSQWDKALLAMEGSVKYRQVSAREAVEQGAREEGVTLPALAERMRTRPGQTPGALLDGLPWHPLLPPEAKAALSDWLFALFLPTLPQQEQGMALARALFDRSVQDSQAAQKSYGKLSVSLGWLAGAALFILLC